MSEIATQPSLELGDGRCGLFRKLRVSAGLRMPVELAGDAGQPSVVASSRLLLGVDGIALDAHGNIYCAVNDQNTLVTVRVDGSLDVLATAADGLDQPSSVAFGTRARGRQTLLVVNSQSPHLYRRRVYSN